VDRWLCKKEDIYGNYFVRQFVGDGLKEVLRPFLQKKRLAKFALVCQLYSHLGCILALFAGKKRIFSALGSRFSKN